MTRQHAEQSVTEAIHFLKGDAAVARLAGLKTAWAVAKWRKHLPPARVLWLAAATGWRYTPHKLSPRLYPNPNDGLPRGLGEDEYSNKQGDNKMSYQIMQRERVEQDADLRTSFGLESAEDRTRVSGDTCCGDAKCGFCTVKLVRD